MFTVGDLRKALEGVPDNLEVKLSSDSGVDQPYPVVVQNAHRVKYELPDGKRFDDTGETGVDYFTIYANYAEESPEDEQADQALQELMDHFHGALDAIGKAEELLGGKE